MATNWIVPTGLNVLKFISLTLGAPITKTNVTGSNENLPDTEADGAATPGQEYEPGESNRRDELVALHVREVRAAIRVVGRQPLSVTADAIPPEAERPVLIMAAWELLNSNLNLQQKLLNSDSKSALAKFYEDACKWLEKLRTGMLVTPPSDPTGADYETAVSADNPAVSGVLWGDSRANDREYAAGVTDSGWPVSTIQNMTDTW